MALRAFERVGRADSPANLIQRLLILFLVETGRVGCSLFANTPGSPPPRKGLKVFIPNWTGSWTRAELQLKHGLAVLVAILSAGKVTDACVQQLVEY